MSQPADKRKLEQIQSACTKRLQSEDQEIIQEWVHFSMYFVINEEYDFANDKLFQLYSSDPANLKDGLLEAKNRYVLTRTIAQHQSQFRKCFLDWLDEKVPDVWDNDYTDKFAYFRKIEDEYNEVKKGQKPEKKTKKQSLKEAKAKQEAAEKQRKHEAYQRQQEWNKKSHEMIDRYQQQQRQKQKELMSQKQTDPQQHGKDDEDKKQELGEEELVDKLGDIIKRAKVQFRALARSWQDAPYTNFGMYVVVKRQYDFDADAMWKQYGAHYNSSADKHPSQAKMTYIWMCAMVEPNSDIGRQFKKWKRSLSRLKDEDAYLEDIKNEFNKLKNAEKEQEKQQKSESKANNKVKEKAKDVEQFRGEYPAYLCLSCRKGGYICERHVEKLIARRAFMDVDDEDHPGYQMYVCQRCWAGHQQCFRHAKLASAKAKHTKYIAKCGCRRCGEIANEQRRCLQCDRRL